MDGLAFQTAPLVDNEVNNTTNPSSEISPHLNWTWPAPEIDDFLPSHTGFDGFESSLTHTGEYGFAALELPPMSDSHKRVLDTPQIDDLLPMTCARPSLITTARMWEYARDFPQFEWSPDNLEIIDNLDLEGSILLLKGSIVRLNKKELIEPAFREMCNFYSDFLARILYDYGLISDTLVEWMLQRYKLSESAKYGMLSTAILVRSYYEKSILATSLRERAKELYSLAIHKLPHELSDLCLSPWTKLASLIEIMNFEYNAGYFSSYYAHGAQAAPLVKTIIGSDTIDLLKLRGEQMFDVCCFAWCDILDSMSTSRPTRFKYVSDIERGTQSSAGSGIEWIHGCPNSLAVLLARTSALRHTQLSHHELMSQGSELEQTIRNLQLHPINAQESALRIARISAQEIWRHTGILYVHHAIFKSDSSHLLVKDSLKNIIKLASTLKPGRNPDCFLVAPYFIIYSDGFENSDTLGNLCKTSPVAASEAIPLEKELLTHVPDIYPDSHDPSSIMPHEELEPQAPNPNLLDSACTNLFDAGPASNANVCTKDSFVQLWEYAQDFGPRVLWPPSGLGPGEEDQFDPEDAMPAIKQSIVALSERALIEPVFQEMCHFYLTYLNRVIYNYALTPERTVGWMLQRFRLSESAKLGMLCTAVLFRSNYERPMLTPSLCAYEKELYSLALQRLPLDLSNPNLSTMAKLVAFTEIMNYEFYAGKLSSYYTHGAQAVPLVKDILGSNNIDLLSLSGEQTFDVRCFAWCDIFDSLATSKPTHFTYESDLESGTATDEKGVEAIFGCPNVVAVLLARTTALRHARISGEEKIRQGMELEQLVRGWQFSPPRTRRSCMRVARVAVQEIWRHAATLYIHHAIFKSHPSNPIVRNSVKDIIKISSVVPPGGNPDCFLQPTYFIVGWHFRNPSE
ncbi:putative clathrin heavy chain [Schizosaccharomyces pombe 972h-] [Rhizoctonia solani]|uniref:Putative clathrin heavy chain [Schizosaccharomyces pombe 972h-] n=1 Tax=Rhizoctonia solani TaxID=456999 RepID=A0A0K6G131_9AGAM|nr:putative clathrin heavy chain [Schizosaccharomyces pombe 972h-] [Rhizoctonia solani]